MRREARRRSPVKASAGGTPTSQAAGRDAAKAAFGIVVDRSAVKLEDLRLLRRFVMGVRQPYLLTRMGQTRRRALRY